MNRGLDRSSTVMHTQVFGALPADNGHLFCVVMHAQRSGAPHLPEPPARSCEAGQAYLLRRYRKLLDRKSALYVGPVHLVEFKLTTYKNI